METVITYHIDHAVYSLVSGSMEGGQDFGRVEFITLMLTLSIIFTLQILKSILTTKREHIKVKTDKEETR